MTGQIDQDIEIDYGGEDDGTHEPDAKINFTDIWDDDEDTENDIWDSL